MRNSRSGVISLECSGLSGRESLMEENLNVLDCEIGELSTAAAPSFLNCILTAIYLLQIVYVIDLRLQLSHALRVLLLMLFMILQRKRRRESTRTKMYDSTYYTSLYCYTAT